MKFTSVRSNVPLSESDYAVIRANVMREIERKERRGVAPIVFRFAFVAAAIVVAFLLWPRKETVVTTPPIAARPQPIAAVASVAQLSAAAPNSAHREGPRRFTHHPRRRHKAGAQMAAVHMEIQTADPDIRIIWITR